MNVPTTFEALFLWIGTPAAAIAALSLIIEWLPAWKKVPEGWKKATFIFLPLLMSVASFAASQAGVIEWLSQYDPLLQAVMTMLVGVIGGQLWHEYWNKPKDVAPAPFPNG